MSAKFLWIQTRDGSPTLWNNELGESFRSVKGAFTESWAAFVAPALDFARARVPRSWVVGEFGLGPGTNWLLWNLASRAQGFESSYFVIESDPTSFEMGLEHWRKNAPLVASFLSDRGIQITSPEQAIEALPRPRIYPSLGAAAQSSDPMRAQIWFHDPFGYDVNPDGYRTETLEACSKLWDGAELWGGSYACNRHFRESLEALPQIQARVVPTGGEGLKRERLEFTRQVE